MSGADSRRSRDAEREALKRQADRAITLERTNAGLVRDNAELRAELEKVRELMKYPVHVVTKPMTEADLARVTYQHPIFDEPIR